MNRIIIVANLGHFKAYKTSKAPQESTRIRLIKSYDSIEAHGKLSEKLSDSAGRFSRGSKKKGIAKGYGEPHDMLIENEKRLIKQIAGSINTLIKKEKDDRWSLAATKAISKQIVSYLDPAVKNRLDKCIASDLTKVDKSEILGYFE